MLMGDGTRSYRTQHMHTWTRKAHLICVCGHAFPFFALHIAQVQDCSVLLPQVFPSFFLAFASCAGCSSASSSLGCNSQASGCGDPVSDGAVPSPSSDSLPSAPESACPSDLPGNPSSSSASLSTTESTFWKHVDSEIVSQECVFGKPLVKHNSTVSGLTKNHGNGIDNSIEN